MFVEFEHHRLTCIIVNRYEIFRESFDDVYNNNLNALKEYVADSDMDLSHSPSREYYAAYDMTDE